MVEWMVEERMEAQQVAGGVVALGEGEGISVDAEPSGVDFPPLEPPKACSFNICTKGHQWPARLQVVECRGCGAPTIVKLNENCPWCNEPIQEMHLRIDQLIPKQQVVRACQGEHGPNTGDISIVRTEDQLEPPA